MIPKNTIFIDDKIENIKTAVNLGFKTIHLIDPYLIKREINNILDSYIKEVKQHTKY